MSQLNIQKCPETGICSIIKEDGSKIDMIPSEADQLQQAASDADKLKDVIQQIDAGFSASLTPEEIDQISKAFV